MADGHKGGASEFSLRLAMVASFWTYYRDHMMICLDLSPCVDIFFINQKLKLTKTIS